ncbi:MAG: glutathione synthase [Candidatus Lambdaproteobacteria bacterium]|nr:glutathione synthase [Candidatus Lambdaproteobacteria bacterium]
MKDPERRLAEAIDFALLNGLLKYTPQGRLAHAPFALTPSPQPARAMARLEALTVPFNALAWRVAGDVPFLRAALEPAARHDTFLRNLLSLTGTADRDQPLRLLVTRNDYLMQIGDTPADDVPRQVELNTISAAYAGLAGRVHALHAHLLAGQPEAARLLPNDPLVGIVEAVSQAHGRYGQPGAVCLMVIQPEERNIFDQRLFEFALLRRGIATRRLSLPQLAGEGALREGHLVVRGEVAALTYFRAGYGPEDYATPDALRARALIEASSTIAVPDVATQLAGAKKVQQLLTDPATLARFCPPEQGKAMAAVFVGQYEPQASLTLGSRKLPAWEAACAEPVRYVLKPQREGGGNNLYDQAMAEALRGMSAEQRDAYILMERIVSRPHDALTVVEGVPRGGPHVSEIGRFGVLLAEGRRELLNRDVGYLVRTKAESSLESGVSAGFGHLDSLLAVDTSS